MNTITRAQVRLVAGILMRQDGFVPAPDAPDILKSDNPRAKAWVEKAKQIVQALEVPAPEDVKDAERYRKLFTIQDFCRDPLWPVVEWMRDGDEHDKATIDAALDAEDGA